MSAAGRCGATELQPSVVLPPLCGRATTASVYDGATALQPPRFALRPQRVPGSDCYSPSGQRAALCLKLFRVPSALTRLVIGVAVRCAARQVSG
jgi:hypothetical protein